MFEEALKHAGVEKDDEGALTRASQLWSFLDNMAATDPKAYKEFIRKQMEEKRKMDEELHPPATLTLRAKNAVHGDTCLVSFCGSDKVPYPQTPTSPVPIVTRKPIPVRHQQAETQLLEVIFNPRVLRECEEDPEAMSMLVDLALRSINNKFGDTFRLSQGHTVRLKQPFKYTEPVLPGTAEGVGTEHQRRGQEAAPRGGKQGPLDTTELLHQLAQQREGRDDDQDGNAAGDDADQAARLGADIRLPDGVRAADLLPHKCQGDGTGLEDEPTHTPSDALGGGGMRDVTRDDGVGEGPARHADAGSSQSCTPLVQTLASTSSSSLPTYRFVRHPTDPDNTTLLEIELPGVTSAGEIDVDIDDDTVELEVPAKAQQLTISLPTPVDADAARAKFLKATATLTLTLPHDKQ